MAQFTINSTVTTQRTLTGNENGLLGQNGAILVLGNDAINATGNNDFVINGTVASDFTGLFFSGSTLELVVGSQGNILSTGFSGVDADASADAFITNQGTISGTGDALRFTATDGLSTLKLINTGDISGSSAALRVVPAGGSSEIFNSGTVSGGSSGIDARAHADAVLRVWNSGTIWGDDFAYQGLTGADGLDRVHNSGLMDGAVSLVGGDDVYNGRSGTVTGTVDGGGGDDTLKGGDGDEEFLGGDGNDLLMGYDGDDDLTGGSGSDTLRGNAGDDTLTGGGKGDQLIGGKGNDVMTGNGGSDRFVLRRVDNGDDEITDFQNGTDTIDLIRLGIQNFNALQSSGALSNDTDAAVIDLDLAGGSGSLRVGGIQVADLDASDFIF